MYSASNGETAGQNPLIGMAALRNTKAYPFNDSVCTVALDKSLKNNHYSVMTEVVSLSGEVGDIIVSGKAVNGFKLEYTGSASEAEIRYYVIGGMEDDGC